MEQAARIRGMIVMIEQMWKLDPRFGADPIHGFLKALIADLNEIASEIESQAEDN